MNRSILSGLILLGVSILCNQGKKPGLFDGAKNLIKANGKVCGSIESLEEINGYLVLNKVVLDKNKIGEIFSGGFIVIPAQRIGMTLDVEVNGTMQTLTNVWIEEMTPYKEGQETIIIDQMAIVIENTDEQPEE